MSLPDWKTIRWNFDGHQGSIPTDLSRYVAMLVEGNLDEREDARDLFFQWPVESARYIGQLGAIPSFLSVLFGVIDEEKTDTARNIELASSFIWRLDDYQTLTEFYDGTIDRFRSAVLKAITDGCDLVGKRVLHPDSQVRREAIRFFDHGQQVQELRDEFRQKANGFVQEILVNDDDPECIACTIQYLVPQDLLPVEQLDRLKNATAWQVQVSVAWAICKSGGINFDSESVQTLSKFSLLGDYPLKDVSHQVKNLGHAEKCNLVKTATDLLKDLGPRAQIERATYLLGLVDSFDDEVSRWAYREVFDEAFRDVETTADLANGKSTLQQSWIRRLTSDDRVWRGANSSLWERLLSGIGLPTDRQSLRTYIDDIEFDEN